MLSVTKQHAVFRQDAGNPEPDPGGKEAAAGAAVLTVGVGIEDRYAPGPGEEGGLEYRCCLFLFFFALFLLFSVRAVCGQVGTCSGSCGGWLLFFFVRVRRWRQRGMPKYTSCLLRCSNSLSMVLLISLGRILEMRLCLCCSGCSFCLLLVL